MLQIKVIVFILTVTLINSAPLDNITGDHTSPSDTNSVKLLKFINIPFDAESRKYQFEYETSDGQGREEVGKIVKNKKGEEYLFVRGSYSHTGPDGIVYTIFYTADENGYHATGDHVPGMEQEVPVVQIDRNAIISLLG